MAPRTAAPAKRTSNAKAAQRWPTRAHGVLLNVLAYLTTINAAARSMDKQMQAIDNMAALGVDAVRQGNAALAQQIFIDIQQRTATIRHTSATVLGAAITASAELAAADRGEYE